MSAVELIFFEHPRDTKITQSNGVFMLAGLIKQKMFTVGIMTTGQFFFLSLKKKKKNWPVVKEMFMCIIIDFLSSPD